MAHRISDTRGLERGSQVRRDVLQAIENTVRAADPRLIVRESVRRKGDVLSIRSFRLDLSHYERTLVLGGGKAALGMALELERILGSRIAGGEVNYPAIQEVSESPRRIVLNPSTHPLPSRQGEEGVREMLRLVGRATPKDLVIFIVSGGASALMPLPAKGITIADKVRVTKLLMASNADITEINAVRKHLSRVKGGRLAQLLYPATVVSLIISDVVGDRLDAIGSGPTAPDVTTFADAKKVLVDHDIWRASGVSVRRVIDGGLRGEFQETPKRGSRFFAKVHNFVLASNRLSRFSAAKELRSRGYATTLLESEFVGEAKVVGTEVGRKLALHARIGTRPWAFVAGGETVVGGPGEGRGGRNQELVLASSLQIAGAKGVAIASIATDGVDGPTTAAGAIADGETTRRAEEIGLDPSKLLHQHDSNVFFRSLGDLLVTGPTGTNVNDVLVCAFRPASD